MSVHRFVYVFFGYGLSFFVFGVTILLETSKRSEFTISRYLPFLGLFGVLHGAQEWTDMFLTLEQTYWPSPLLKAGVLFSLCLGTASYVFLFLFGIHCADFLKEHSRMLKVAAAFFVALLVSFGILEHFSIECLSKLQIAARYGLCFPASLTTAFLFYRYSCSAEIEKLRFPRAIRSLKGLAAVFAVYSLAAGLVVPKGNFFPASRINTVTFLHCFGIPVQVLRAVCAIAAVLLIHGLIDIFAIEATATLETALAQLRHTHEALQFEASHDFLVKLWNRKAIIELLKAEISRADRLHASVSVLLADLDYFKRVNDTYGHSVGDDVLLLAAERMSSAVRQHDHVGRYGGEEFLAVLPDCTAETAQEVAERVRQQIGGEPLANDVEVTVSIGVSQWHPGQEISEFLKQADIALYRAKQNGRNRVEVETAYERQCV